MKRAEFVVLDQFADWEGALLAALLNQVPNWQVAYASNQPVVHSIGGLTVQVDHLINQIPEHLDLLVLIGGNSWHLENQSLQQLIQHRLKQQEPVAAICGAVDYLAENGLLTGYQHTGNSLALWQEFGAYTNQTDFREQQVVVTPNLVTANGTATLDFTRAVLKMVRFDKDVDKKVDLYQLGFYQYVKEYGNPFG